MDNTIDAGRLLMGDSLAFHIIFVMFGLTFPILVSWFEWLGIRKKDKRYTDIARLWSKVMAVLVITGVISGTIIALQMSLVWPGILKFGGKVIGLPFMFETYAFLIEAVFLSLYMATWNSKKVSQWIHWFIGLFVVLGSTLSAYAITSVNAWMNSPTGFDYVNGSIQNVSVTRAMFSETAVIEFLHSMPGYYLSVALCLVGLYSFSLLKLKASQRQQKQYEMNWVVVRTLMVFAGAMFICSAITADLTGKYLAKQEPVKLAAIELMYQTQDHAPLIVGGVAGGEGKIKGPHIKVPNALSILAGNSPSTVVKGLNEYPKEEQPPLYVHTLFDIKMTIITAFVVIFGAYFVFRKWRPEILQTRWSLGVLSVMGILSICIVELGWMMTEIGRQPWAVRGFVTTDQAFTKAHDVTSFGYVFPLAYVLLFAVTVLAIRKIVKDKGDNRKRGEK